MNTTETVCNMKTECLVIHYYWG